MTWIKRSLEPILRNNWIWIWRKKYVWFAAANPAMNAKFLLCWLRRHRAWWTFWWIVFDRRQILKWISWCWTPNQCAARLIDVLCLWKPQIYSRIVILVQSKFEHSQDDYERWLFLKALWKASSDDWSGISRFSFGRMWRESRLRALKLI